MAEQFRGWSPAALAFYRDLEADNTKAFWTAHKDVYDAEVRAPMEALGAAIEDEFGPLVIFRPYRDVRFSKDKAPYKTAIGAHTEGEDGETYYVSLSGQGLTAGTGYYQFAADQLARFREAIDDERTADQLDRIVVPLEKQGFVIGGEDLKTAPRGVPRDHHHIRWMRHKRLYTWKELGTPKWLGTKQALKRVTDAWRAPKALHSWLAANVGPSTLPPEEASF